MNSTAILTLGSLHKSGLHAALGLAGWLLVCFAAGGIGSFFMPDAWYAAINKPTWNPPGWLFGPVWSALYAMMAVAAWLVWRQGGFAMQRRPLGVFFVQLALNSLWSPLFFGLHSPGLAFAEIILLWAAIATTITVFRRVHGVAALLLVPYLLWVSFASLLNFTLWRLNS